MSTRPVLPILTALIPLSLSCLADDAVIPRTVVTADALDDIETLSSGDLAVFQSTSLDELSGVVPGLHVVSGDTAGYGNIYTMRGSGNVLFFGPPAVGVTIDGVPQANAFAFPTELMELEAVGVHRGPQGAYGGSNAPAGRIDLVTPRPGESQRFKLRTEYGEYDSLGAGLFSSGPIAGDFSHTFQLYYRERDGFIRNSFLGGHLDDRSLFGGQLKVFWTPNDDFEAWVSFSAESVDDGASRLSSLVNPLASPDPFTVASDNPGTTQLERYSISTHFSKRYDWGTISSVGGFSWWDLDPSRVDLDLSFPAINGGLDLRSDIRQSQDTMTREFRYDAPEDSPIQWQAGVHFMDVENSGLATRQLDPALIESTSFQIDQRTYALFANAEYEAGNGVTLDGGFRVDFHEAEIDRLKTSTFGAPAPVASSLDDVYLSPTVGVAYQASDALRLHARTGLGIKPAGFTAYADDPATARFDEETNWSTEIGFDYTPCPEVRAGVRAYFNQVDDYQVNQSLAGMGPFPPETDFVIANAQEVQVWGVEAELVWQPIENVTIRGAVGWQDAEFDEYVFYDPTALATSNFSGNPVPYVPEFTGSLGIRYDFGNGFYAQTAVRAVGETYFDSAGTTKEGSYAVWNAEVGYEANGFGLALYGSNLLDEGYYTFINSQILAGAPGDPQLFGVRATMEF